MKSTKKKFVLKLYIDVFILIDVDEAIQNVSPNINVDVYFKSVRYSFLTNIQLRMNPTGIIHQSTLVLE